ncbi:MAG TPA: phosphoglucosamine mutase [Wenzhouxiangella sp.]|nr:phosphoglucosamine mutase [Wenzhouxiangella sp.]
MKKMKYFGTDGIRGRAGEPPITVDFMLHLGWAVGRVLAERFGERAAVVIGKDTRISGYQFESALEAGFSAAGVDIMLLGPMPTPAVAHLTRSMHAAAGVVISASHNPFHDNGVKFFAGDGHKLGDEMQAQVEERLQQPIRQVPNRELGKAWRIYDAIGRYIEFCKGTLTWGIQLNGLKIVVDSANGANYRIGPEVFRELGADVVSIFDKPDGFNINRDCGSTHPQALARRVVEEQADLGLAFDGDGDRVILVDHRGEPVDGDQILFVLAEARRAAGELNGGVVGTVMSNFGLEQAFAQRNIDFVRSQVGDRHVHEALLERGWVLGGEASGHILCLDRAASGCGIVSALQVLEVMVKSGRSLADLTAGMQRCPQTTINVPVASRKAVNLEHEGIVSALRSAENDLGDQGRVILRPSGTEPVVRVTVEGFDAAQVDRLVNRLAGAVEEALAAA